jgi:hypothetical protein
MGLKCLLLPVFNRGPLSVTRHARIQIKTMKANEKTRKKPGRRSKHDETEI